jgi:hypothetical protein
MKRTISWDITLCNPLRVNRSFGGIYRLHLQDRKISRGRNQRESRCLRAKGRALLATSLHAGLLLGLFFYPENGGDIFFRNVS